MPGMVETLRLVIEGSSAGGQKALKDLDRQAGATSAAMQGHFKVASAAITGGLLAVGTAAAAFAAKSLKTYEDYGKEVKAVQRMTGATAEEASLIVGQMKLIGGEQLNTAEALGRWGVNLGKARQEGTAQNEVMKRLGVNLKDANGAYRDGAAVLLDYRNAVSAETDVTQRNMDLQTMMGRSYRQVAAYFSKSTEEMAASTQFLRKNGLILSEDDMQMWSELMTDQKKFAMVQVAIQLQMGKLVGQLESKVMPTVITLFEWINKVPSGVWLVVGAFAGLAGVWRTYKTLSEPIRGVLGLFGGGASAARVAGTEAETVAIGTQTAALEANTLARGANAAAGGGWGYSMGGTSTGARVAGAEAKTLLMQSEAGVANSALGTTVPGALGTGTTGMGVAGGGAAAGAAGTSALASTAMAAGAAAVAAAGLYAVYKLGYAPWKKALAEEQEAVGDFADTVTSQFDRIANKYGETSKQLITYTKNTVADTKASMDEVAGPGWLSSAASGVSKSLTGGLLDLGWGNGIPESQKQAKALIEQIQTILGQGRVEAGSEREGQLRKLYNQLVDIKDPSDQVKNAIAAIGAALSHLDPGALMTADEVTQQLAADAEQAAQAIADIATKVGSLGNLGGFLATAQGMAMTEQEISQLTQQLAQNQSDAAVMANWKRMLSGKGWSPAANADNRPLGTPGHPVRYHQFAGGGSGVAGGSDGALLALIGEDGREPYAIGEKAMRGIRGTDGHRIVVTVTGNTFVGTSRDAERALGDMLERRLGKVLGRLDRGGIGRG